jgi:hypothetical protein
MVCGVDAVVLGMAAPVQHKDSPIGATCSLGSQQTVRGSQLNPGLHEAVGELVVMGRFHDG